MTGSRVRVTEATPFTQPYRLCGLWPLFATLLISVVNRSQAPGSISLSFRLGLPFLPKGSPFLRLVLGLLAGGFFMDANSKRKELGGLLAPKPMFSQPKGIQPLRQITSSRRFSRRKSPELRESLCSNSFVRDQQDEGSRPLHRHCRGRRNRPPGGYWPCSNPVRR